MKYSGQNRTKFAKLDSHRFLTVWNVLKQSRAVTHRLASHVVTGFAVHPGIRQLEPRFSLPIPMGQAAKSDFETSGLGKNCYHAMILSWPSYHYHGETWSWSWRNMVMIMPWRLCFLTYSLWFMAWSSWFMAWLRCFLWFIQWSPYDYDVFHDSYRDHNKIFNWKMNCLSMFFHIVAAIYQYMAQMIGLRRIFASKLPNQQNWKQILPEIEFSSLTTGQQVLIWQ